MSDALSIARVAHAADQMRKFRDTPELRLKWEQAPLEERQLYLDRTQHYLDNPEAGVESKLDYYLVDVVDVYR